MPPSPASVHAELSDFPPLFLPKIIVLFLIFNIWVFFLKVSIFLRKMTLFSKMSRTNIILGHFLGNVTSLYLPFGFYVV